VIDIGWNIVEDDRDDELTGAPRPILGTWHYLQNSLRRDWRVCGLFAVLGVEVGLALIVLMPPASTGTVTLLMSHPASMDGPSAMATDVSLLTTREVAERTVRQLGLAESPDVFQTTISAEPVTTEILTLHVVASDDRSAVARVDALTKQYLGFRSEQLKSLSSGLISGYKARIASMQEQVDALGREYSQVSQQGAESQTRATEILTQRTGLSTQITDMQQAIEEASLQSDAAISSTHVIDPPRAAQRSTKKTMVLDAGSGLIAGLALGVGFVLFRALTSDRVRRRQDVALALGAPVRIAVASRGPRRARAGWLRRRLTTRPGWRRGDLEALVHGLESALVPRGGAPGHPGPATSESPSRVAVAAVGNAPVAADVIAAVAKRYRHLGLSVFLVDLSPSGALSARLDPAPGRKRKAAADPSPQEPRGVFRPSGVPGLARGPLGAGPWAVIDLPVGDVWRQSWDDADVVIALVEVDPGIDVENLTSWVDQAVPLVTAGQSTGELLETTAELIRGAGLRLPFAMMVGSDSLDQSAGTVAPPPAGERITPVRQP
jgi:capsular polysaccharide biosynthesis protein